MKSLPSHNILLHTPTDLRFNVYSMRVLLFSIFLLASFSLACQENIDNKLHQRYYAEIEKKMEIFGIEKHDKVCDFGTGTSNTMYLMACFIDSIDIYLQDIDSALISEEIIEENIKSYSETSDNIYNSRFNYIIGEERKTNLPDNYYDKIIMVKVLHHIPDKNKSFILKSLSKSLNSNGVLILGDMVKSSSRNECQGNRLLTENEIKKLLQSTGYKLIGTDIEKTERSDLYYFIAKKENALK